MYQKSYKNTPIKRNSQKATRDLWKGIKKNLRLDETQLEKIGPGEEVLEPVSLDELGLEAGQVGTRQPVPTVRQQAGQPQGNRVRHQLCHTLLNVVDVLSNKIDQYEISKTSRQLRHTLFNVVDVLPKVDQY